MGMCLKPATPPCTHGQTAWAYDWCGVRATHPVENSTDLVIRGMADGHEVWMHGGCICTARLPTQCCMAVTGYGPVISTRVAVHTTDHLAGRDSAYHAGALRKRRDKMQFVCSSCAVSVF